MKRKTVTLGVLAFLCLVLAACGLGEEKIVELNNNQGKKGENAEYGTKQQTLSSCSGFWGDRWRATVKSRFYSTGLLLNAWTPNCSMGNKDKMCGPDNDKVVSFWLGPDFSGVFGRYSTNWRLNSWLYWQANYSAGFDTRIYTGQGYGRLFGNAYSCIPSWADPSTLRLVRYR